MKNQKVLMAFCLAFSLTFCVNSMPIDEEVSGKDDVADLGKNEKDLSNKVEGEQGTKDEELSSPYSIFTPSSSFSSTTNSNTNDQIDEENNVLSPTHIETTKADDFEDDAKNVAIENENEEDLVDYGAENEEILKPLKYALKQIYIVLGSFLDENSLKMVLEGNDVKPRHLEKETLEASDSVLDKDNEAEDAVTESNQAPESELQPSEVISSQKEVADNEKLIKMLHLLKEGSTDTICFKEHTVHQQGIFELLKHLVQHMVVS
ncbi:unnamed protein product [Meloidogyne enterolobii]|uniref:Uncharacterized protein n=1 Tax=Meloidogyne enterolobii TaxID=390850 RepID=A0ACB1AQZ3_MELEN